ncbi:MAG: hypothetical protein GY807_13495 [Gammaproteobacteria bacterium]|nr:hypothetical protein [Gammaproteobacteria bacterium]
MTRPTGEVSKPVKVQDTLAASRAKKERAAASEPARFPGKPDHVDPVASITRTFQAYVI